MYHALYNHSVWSWISRAFRAWDESIKEALIPFESEEATNCRSTGGATIDGENSHEVIKAKEEETREYDHVETR